MKLFRNIFMVFLLVLASAVPLTMQGCSDQKQNPVTSDLAPDTLSTEGVLPGIPPDTYPDAPPIPPIDSALRERIETALSVMGVSSTTILNQTYSWLGVPYVYGGNGRGGIDCSHLVYQVYRNVGIPYPYMTTPAMRSSARFISVKPVPGVIILFWGINHCGIYIGNGWMIDANYYYGKVRYDYIYDSYWAPLRPNAVRFIG
jgi:cell wall-associated NlpC family hydrolase